MTGQVSIREVYGRRARRYDLTSNLYYLMGVPITRYRQRAVEALQLVPGAKVLDLACGTGLNFEWLQAAIGPTGRLIGLDFTPAMLDQARERVKRMGWDNVTLIEGDATAFTLPELVDAVLSTFALSTMPAGERAVQSAIAVLRNGGRLTLLDIKRADGAFRFLNPLAVPLTRPFGGTEEALKRRPWEEMRRSLEAFTFQELYLGFIYLATGMKPTGGSHV